MPSFARLRSASLLLILIICSAFLPRTVRAQDASTPEPAAGVEVVATGLSAPRAFTWGPEGALYVAQSGPGKSELATGTASSVVKIVDGCPVAVASGLPSTFDPFRDALGPMDVQFVGDQLYVLQTATGPYGGGSPTPAEPNGIYTAEQDGSVALWLDMTDYIDSFPPVYLPGDYNELAEPYRFLVDGDGFWLIDSNRSLVYFIGLDKSVELVADLSLGHPILTAMVLDGEGGVYIGNLTPAPHTDGSAQVIHLDRQGNQQQVWTNLTTVTGLALDGDQQLYAIEMATGNGGPDGMRAGTGRLLKQTGLDTYDVLVYGFEYPISLGIGPDGDFYISLPAFGANAQSGAVVRIPADASGLTFDSTILASGKCPGANKYVAPSPVPPGSPVAASTETPTAATPSPAHANASPQATPAG